jgi:dTMP kinase
MDLIVLEGADRLGKSTQARLLTDALKNQGIRSRLVKAPFREPALYERIYQMLSTGEASQEPVVFQTLMIANRRIWQSYDLPNLQEKYDVIVMDRWTLSTKVYGGASGVEEKTTEVMTRGLIQPQLTILLDGEPFPMEAKPDAYEADKEFQSDVRRRYLQLASSEDSTHIVSANRSQEEVHQDIMVPVMKLVNRY